MDALLSGISMLLTLTAIALAIGFGLRYRSTIVKWINPTYYACDDRKLKLQRKIEDCQKELDWIKEEERAETEGR